MVPAGCKLGRRIASLLLRRMLCAEEMKARGEKNRQAKKDEDSKEIKYNQAKKNNFCWMRGNRTSGTADKKEERSEENEEIKSERK